MMENNGVLVCNDYKGSRLRPLGLNLQRAGVTNSIITLMKGQNFKDLKFDKILVDAPCSGTGTIRKSLKTLTMWNPDVVKRLSLVQKNLIETGINMLKEDGTLVYSTCSQEPHENEAVIDFLLNKFDVRLEEIKIDLNRSKPILEFDGDEYDSEVKKSLRIWPQDNDTEGFFVAKIKKA